MLQKDELLCGLEIGELLLVVFVASIALACFKAWLDDRESAAGLRMAKQAEEAKRRCAAIRRWHRTVYMCKHTRDLLQLDNVYYAISYEHPDLGQTLDMERKQLVQEILSRGECSTAVHEDGDHDATCDHHDCDDDNDINY